MNFITKYAAIAALLIAPLSARAASSVLSVADHVNDSTIVYPESVETDVQQMMQNWYLRNYTALDKGVETRPDVVTSDEELIHRLQSIPTVIEMPFNSVIRNYIDMYTGKKRGLVESMLGMSLYYMPIFEEALEREGLPIELKFLPVIESALNPDAVSRAGATGLWQIMMQTARGLGLEVSTLVDERRDPIASSAAATRYLRQLYEIYNDWHLAIAAYNCGPGNINKALRRAGADNDDSKKDFWAIYPYLPQETRGYVPCFIAATYVMNHYDKHNISPALAKKPILTDSVHVHHRINFKQISDVLHIPVDELQILNPQYRQQEIPGDIRPYSLVLPANQIYAFILSEKEIAARDAELYARRDVVEPATGLEPRTATVNGQEGEWVTEEVVKYHKVRRKETMSSIARKYGVTLSSLKRANGGISKPRRGSTLKIVTTKEVFKPYEPEPQPTVEPNDNLLVANTPAEQPAAETPAAEEPAAVATEVTEAPAADSSADLAANDTADTAAAPAETAAETETEADAAAGVQEKVAGTFRSSHAKQEAERTATQAKAEKSSSSRDSKKSTSSKKNNKKSSKARTHTVRAGESLYTIAQKNGTTVKELRRLNGIKGNKIKPGDKIKVK